MSITPSPQNPYKCRSLFVSDLHMGSRRFDAELFTRFIASYDPEKLFLGGDIIDGWKLCKRWYWPKSYVKATAYILKIAEEKQNVIYITGNHDDRLRLLPSTLNKRLKKGYGLQLLNKCIYEAADGRKFLVIHGDQFDWKILHGKLSQFGDRLFDWVTGHLLFKVNPRIRVNGKWKKFSLSKTLRKSGTRALYLIQNFEKAVFQRIEKDSVDGLICGHTHVPIVKTMNNKTYINTGSWMSDMPTALIEHLDGRFELIRCNPEAYALNRENLFDDIPDFPTDLSKAIRLEEWAQHLWPEKIKLLKQDKYTKRLPVNVQKVLD